MRGANMGGMTDKEGCQIEIVSDKENYLRESSKAFAKCESYKSLIANKLKGFDAKAYNIRYESSKKLAQPVGTGSFKVVSGETKLDFALWVKAASEKNRKEIDEAIKDLPELLNLRTGNEITYKLWGADRIELHIMEKPVNNIVPSPFARAVQLD